MAITFLEETHLNYSLLTCYSYCNFDNDATVYYDQNLCAITSLCGCKFGIYKDVVFVHTSTLEVAEFKSKIYTKMSETLYKHCAKFPIHEMGQGSTNSPTIWCFVSSVSFQCHNKKAHGIYLNHCKATWLYATTSLDLLTIILASLMEAKMIKSKCLKKKCAKMFDYGTIYYCLRR